MQSLSKNILAFLAESTASPKVRPTLSYIYYNPTTKKAVSTDSFRLHEISIDLWENQLLFDTKWNIYQPYEKPLDYHGYNFPDYENFFPTEQQAPTFSALIDIEILKSMDYHMKPYQYNSIINFSTWHISNNKKYQYNNIIALDIKQAFQKLPSQLSTTHDIGININYLYNALWYMDKPTKRADTPVNVQSKSELSPIAIHWIIDNAPARALIMPLKI